MYSKNQTTEAASASRVDKLVDDRLKRLEKAHQTTRDQIEQLEGAKSEVLRLGMQVEKSAAISLAREHSFNADPLQQQAQEIIRLKGQVESKKEECQQLKSKVAGITQHAQKEAESFRRQLETAQDRHKQLETEKMRLLRNSKNRFLKGMLIGLGFSLLMAALGMGFFMLMKS
jgi:hypothetical protein